MIRSFQEYVKRARARRKFWNEIDDGDLDDEESEIVKRRVKRKVYERENYSDSCWFKFLQRRDISDITSRDGKLFRNRFTVPYQLFIQLLTFAESWFPQHEYDCCKKKVPPVSLKLLGPLRILGKGCSWDLLYELSGVSAEVHRRWTLTFIEKFSKDMYPVYVHGPRDSSELSAVTSLYAASGFPGCVGSTDVVHIRWEMCPSIWTTAFRNGKHDYCSIAYEMTVSHSKKFQATTIGHYGTTSDKTIVKFDGFVSKVRFDELFTMAEFKIQVAPDKWILERGVYLLVDGGYHRWRIMQCPLKHTTDTDRARWSEFAESIRKDVECSFGILKKRFQFLKTGITWHRKSDIDNAVFSCVILHNMLHEFDGYDEKWEDEIDNSHNDKEEQIHLDKIRRRVVRAVENTNDYSHVGRLQNNMNNINFAHTLDQDVAVEISNEHEVLRDKLVRHLTLQYLAGTLRWLTIAKK